MGLFINMGVLIVTKRMPNAIKITEYANFSVYALIHTYRQFSTTCLYACMFSTEPTGKSNLWSDALPLAKQ